MVVVGGWAQGWDMNSSGVTAGALRVSDAEREPVIERLKEAYAEGRIDHAEFDMRVHLAMVAKTRSELAAVVADLRAMAPLPEPRVVGRVGLTEKATGEDRMLAAFAHGSGAVTLFVGPLVFLLLSGKRSAYVRAHAAEALNFQLTLLLVTIATLGLGGVVYAVAWIAAGIAAVVSLTGRGFRYPWTVRAIK